MNFERYYEALKEITITQQMWDSLTAFTKERCERTIGGEEVVGRNLFDVHDYAAKCGQHHHGGALAKEIVIQVRGEGFYYEECGFYDDRTEQQDKTAHAPGWVSLNPELEEAWRKTK